MNQYPPSRKLRTSNNTVDLESGSFHGLPVIGHISHLSSSNEAEVLLKRIQNEFSEITSRRGYKIKAVTELCCCDDGIHYIANNLRMSRKFRKMGENVLGYNLNRTEIHLRLRTPYTHQLLPYEDIARTMCHELAHCEISVHNEKFFALMEEIQRQHELYLKKGVVLDKQGFPLASKEYYVIGIGKKPSTQNKRNVFADAATKRLSKPQNEPRILGGRKSTLRPREATRIAAERRLQEVSRCLTQQEIIDLVKIDEEPLTLDDGILEDHDDCIIVDVKKPSEIPITKKRKFSSKNTWACLKCTFENKEDFLTCTICAAPKRSEEESRKFARSIQLVNDIKEKEDKSVEEFNGFNIYGKSSLSSSTIKRLI